MEINLEITCIATAELHRNYVLELKGTLDSTKPRELTFVLDQLTTVMQV